MTEKEHIKGPMSLMSFMSPIDAEIDRLEMELRSNPTFLHYKSMLNIRDQMLIAYDDLAKSAPEGMMIAEWVKERLNKAADNSREVATIEPKTEWTPVLPDLSPEMREQIKDALTTIIKIEKATGETDTSILQSKLLQYVFENTGYQITKSDLEAIMTEIALSGYWLDNPIQSVAVGSTEPMPTTPVVKKPQREKRPYRRLKKITTKHTDLYGRNFRPNDVRIINCCLDHLHFLEQDTPDGSRAYATSDDLYNLICDENLKHLLGGKQTKDNLSTTLSQSRLFIPHKKKGWSLPE